MHCLSYAIHAPCRSPHLFISIHSIPILVPNHLCFAVTRQFLVHLPQLLLVFGGRRSPFVVDRSLAFGKEQLFCFRRAMGIDHVVCLAIAPGARPIVFKTGFQPRLWFVAFHVIVPKHSCVCRHVAVLPSAVVVFGFGGLPHSFSGNFTFPGPVHVLVPHVVPRDGVSFRVHHG